MEAVVNWKAAVYSIVVCEDCVPGARLTGYNCLLVRITEIFGHMHMTNNKCDQNGLNMMSININDYQG